MIDDNLSCEVVGVEPKIKNEKSEFWFLVFWFPSGLAIYRAWGLKITDIKMRKTTIISRAEMSFILNTEYPIP
jgi:hypothetical protein